MSDTSGRASEWTFSDSGAIRGFHAHVYFDANTVVAARALCEAASARFPVRMGRVHEKLVGPHPRFSCQLAFEPPVLGDLLSWLALNRQGLTVFVHPQTGDDLTDHTNHAIWMGQMLELDLDVLKRHG
ncbi:MAG: 4,5-dioxygenase [Gammaproteobacteria bacterium]|nr:4,5-dioxygenase [Gammaproteobacteria bacterium]